MKQQQQEQQKQRRQQQERGEASDGCDESKCVSNKGSSHLSNNFFTCYGDGEFYPMMCADGYQPRVVENEPPILDAYPPWMHWLDGGDILTQYFTCCPPDLSDERNVTRHCSDPIATYLETDGNDANTMICNDNTRQHPRRMKTNKDLNSEQLGQSYMCCDSIILNDENTTDFLDETECVPYYNEFYLHQFMRNKYGAIAAITCNFPDGDYEFPRPVEIDDSLSTGYEYECCKTGPAMPPFVQDTAFKLTIYPIIALSSIAVISCIIVILGLSIPLLMQLKNGTYQTTQQTSRRNPSRGSRSQSLRSLSLGSLVSQRSRRVESSYSPYNLYLVYLAIPDLIINLYILGMHVGYANQTFNPKFHAIIIYTWGIYEIKDCFEGVILIVYATANLYLNAVVAYEVLILLRNSHQLKKRDPPSILKMSLQAATVYIFSIVYSLLYYFVFSADSKEYIKDDFDKTAILLFVVMVFSVGPFGVVGYVCIIIWWRGYMSSINGISQRDKMQRELAWYFFRIIAVFVAIWIPGIILTAWSAIAGEPSFGLSSRWGYAVVGLFLAIQPMISTCVAMTKSDVKKYIFELITLSYVRRSRMLGMCRTTTKTEEELPSTMDLQVQTETNSARICRRDSTRSISIVSNDEMLP